MILRSIRDGYRLAFQVAPRIFNVDSRGHVWFCDPMSLYYKFVAVRQEGRIPQFLAQHSFLSKALVGEHRALFSCRIWP